MKIRVAVVALAIAFLAAPALAAFAGAGCAPCGDMAQGDAPCTALSAASCCGDLAPSPPAKTAPEMPTLLLALAGVVAIGPTAIPVRAPLAAPDLTAPAAGLRLSVVRRL
jgi:hypothetical protein